ncbi:MAG: nucleoside monophosphate kinase [Candidatus Peribacteria bacterium]|jgi:adenylate kinase|nr:nucleoside monophosphate kinase [Candidatus Peribacteria bacterium]
MKDIILMGIQGSGKGTQAKFLREHFGEKMKYFEMGGILRALQATDNVLGKYISYYTKNGLLINPAIPAGLWRVFMETLQEGEWILGDGMLRTLEQTIQIVQQMRERDRSFVVVCLEIPDEEVYKRLTHRAKLDGNNARKDDTDAQAIKNRIEAFHRETEPALEWLEGQGVLVRVNGMQTEEEIFGEILRIVEK